MSTIRNESWVLLLEILLNSYLVYWVGAMCEQKLVNDLSLSFIR